MDIYFQWRLQLGAAKKLAAGDKNVDFADLGLDDDEILNLLEDVDEEDDLDDLDDF